MSEALSWDIQPTTNLRTGMSLFVVAKGNHAQTLDETEPTAWLTAVSGGTGLSEAVELKLESVGTGEWRKEFTLMLPGDYQVKLGTQSKVIHVTKQQFMNFGLEFGIFSTAVVLLVGGMLIWLRKNTQKNNAAKAGSH